MRLFYKHPKTGQVFEYSTKAERDEWGDKELVQLSKEEVAAVLSPTPKTQDQINAEARAYLASTDWYVVRQQETGEQIPAEVIKQRSDARAKVIEE